MTVMNLDKLGVWRRAKDFAIAVYKEVVPHLLLTKNGIRRSNQNALPGVFPRILPKGTDAIIFWIMRKRNAGRLYYPRRIRILLVQPCRKRLSRPLTIIRSTIPRSNSPSFHQKIG